MFREMRRKRQLLAEEESRKILEQCTAGVLAVAGDDDYPYAVPVSYVYREGRLYVHSALTGHKIDGLKRNPRVSFCIVAQDEIVPQKFTTCFRSVIVFGKARIVEDEQECRQILRWLGAKYAPGQEENCEEEIRQQIARTAVIEITAEHITGKEAIEIVRAREEKATV